MSRARRASVWAWLACALLALATTASAAERPLEASRALLARLRASGRAEAVLQWSVTGPDGKLSRERGALALEPPSLARLDVPRTAEQVTLRPDGGEWLQPGLRQLLRLSPRHAGAAMRWWRLLAGGAAAAGEGGARERRVAPGRYRIVLTGPRGQPNDSAEVWLDPRGLPSRLVLGEPGEGQDYRLGGWRFLRARGERDFRLTAPAGFEDVALP